MGAAVLVGSMPIASSAADPDTMPPQPGDQLVRATGADKTTPLTPGDLEAGGRPIQAWPLDPATGTVRRGTLYNMLMVTRWDPAEIGEAGAERHAEGVVAFTVICTHSACEVVDWVPDQRLVECPCHFSRYDLRNNGAVVQGPSRRKLPSLALAIKDGKITVARPFDGRVGGDVEA